MNLDQLLHCVDKRSVLRYTVDLATSSSDGLVCPPTYAHPEGSKDKTPRLAFRQAFVHGEPRNVVVLDSPQSQSNRIELALLQASRAGQMAYPDIEIRFPKSAKLQEPVYSVLQLSHRIYDAVLRACTLDSRPFFEGEVGQAILSARPSMATALFVHAPAPLVLGAWDSNGGSGPLATKLPRLMTSEIIGLDASPAELFATKFDPMDIRKQAAELIATGANIRRFEIKSPASAAAKPVKADKADKADKIVSPSSFGFGSIPANSSPRAAIVSGALQTSVLSFSGLRQLSFPDGDGEINPARDQAARAVLAALALYGLMAQNESGYLLRSRCELLPRDEGRWDIIGRSLAETETTQLGAESARQLLLQACQHAKTTGLAFRTDILRLEADDRLQELVRRSRAAAAQDVSPDEA